MTDDEDVQSIARDLAHRYPDMCAADFERAEQIIFSNPPPKDRPRSHKMFLFALDQACSERRGMEPLIDPAWIMCQ